MKITDWLANVFPKQERRRPLVAYAVSAWVETLENRVLLSAQSVLAGSFATMPGTPLDDVELDFELNRGQGTFQEMGVFLFDADGTVDGLSPGEDGFDDAVLDRKMLLFDDAAPLGSTAQLTFAGGDRVGIYFCQDQEPALSAERFDAAMTSDRSFRIGFEENASLWPSASNANTADRRFDDAVIDVTLSEPMPFAPPTLAPLDDVTIPEQELFELTIAGENPAGPASDLRYRLDVAPEGAVIDEVTGEFSWTPTEAQGPGRYDVVVVVFNSTRPAASASQRFSINVTEVNRAPVIAPITPADVNQLETLSIQITASDPDRPINPQNRFTFSLVDNTTAGATIDPETGVFTWTPAADQGPGTFLFEVRVVDNGNPQLEDTEIFTVHVDPAV